MTQSNIRDALQDQGISTLNVQKRLSELVQDKEIRRIGKRGNYIYFLPEEGEEWEGEERDTPGRRLVREMDKPKVLAEAMTILEERKRGRQHRSLVRLYEEAAQRQLRAEEEDADRLTAAMEKLLNQRLRYWDSFILTLTRFDEKVCTYFREFDNLPQPLANQARHIDTGIEDVRRHLSALEFKLFPGRVKGKGAVERGSFIDVKAEG